MNSNSLLRQRIIRIALLLVGLSLLGAAAFTVGRQPRARSATRPTVAAQQPRLNYQRRQEIDTAGFVAVLSSLKPWDSSATFEQIRDAWQGIGYRGIEQIDRVLAQTRPTEETRLELMLRKAMFYNYEGEPKAAYKVLTQLRSQIEHNDRMAQRGLYSVIFYQGVTALRRGENENCILCRGESSCIIPISAAAVHINPEGSRLAIGHFTEYLEQFPDDLDVRWLLNLAHMTLGEHPQKVDPRFLVSLDRFTKSEFDIGRFRDIGHLVGVNRLNQAGGAIMEDFDNDGLLDIATTTVDASGCMAFYRNTGRGVFEECAESAGLADQLGGLYCVQTDYNNDGYKDIFVVRGAWLSYPQRPSLLRNNANGTFTDVTLEAGLMDPVNSISASWADYDNDGWLDLFICCERQPSRLYRNLGNGTFSEVAREAGVDGGVRTDCKGSAWIDYDNDGWQDLFLNYQTNQAESRLFHNDRNGAFTEVTDEMGISGPAFGFSCWAWDYDNDGWLDLFATSYERELGEAVKGLVGEPHQLKSGCLYHNRQGRSFENKTREAGLDMVFVTMGSNFGDFDNDGFLDFYLGTGDPHISMLVPNRMFKNVAGRRFAEITGT